MEANNIYLENLCSSAEFKKMSVTERKDYIDKNFYHGAPFKILAKIEKINSPVMLIRATHFLTPDNRMIEFKLCHDADFARIGSIGYYDKLRESIENYCDKNNLKENDKVICTFSVQANQNQIDKGRLLTFSIKSVKKANLIDLQKFYAEHNITCSPNQLYELRDDDKRELNIFVQDNICDEIEKILSDGDSSIEAQKKTLTDLKTQSAELEKQLKIRQASYDNLQKKFVEKYKEEEKELHKKLSYLHTFDVDLPELNNELDDGSDEKFLDDLQKISFDDFEEMIDHWKKYLQKNCGLIYSKEILKSLYFGLQTDKLILLTGNPGTGKTSLVKALAKSFNFKDSAIISVQSNWTDKGDLLGYYNPIEKNYIATEFLDALIKFSRLAKLQPEKLFIICLDEMNLAHVEHYFAEFLSSLQNNREINLYSEKMQQNIIRELQANGQNEDGTFDQEKISSLNLEERKYYFELCRLAQMTIDYPAKIKIPSNVKFFGTLNQDETTHDISPKVIDRSYIIRLERNELQLENLDEDYSQIKYRNLEDYSQKYEEIFNVDDFDKKLCAVANISKRVTKEVLRSESFETWTKVLGVNDVEDFIIASFLLPKIRFDEDEYKKKMDSLQNLCTGHKLSEIILSQIDNGNEADFWRR